MTLLAVSWCLACGSPSPGDDAGMPGADTGTPGADAGTPGVDAGADAGTSGEGIETTVASTNTGATGEIAVTVPIDGHRSFMVVGTSDVGRLAVIGIDDPSGASVLHWEDWYNESYGLTNAFWASDPTTVINWPVRDVDPALVRGDYVVHLGSYRADGVTERPDVDVEVTTLRSRDPDVTRGRVRVALVWAEGLDADMALVSATEAAVAHWAEVWASAGMDIEVRYLPSTLDPVLPSPGPMETAFYLTASALAEPGEIVLVIGEIIGTEATQYGEAGQLPGPLVPSSLSAIIVGWLANAGGDGVFSANDIQLYGEVLAHEVGHYLGLFHPVSWTYDYWDAIDDTLDCTSEGQCESMIGTNLMFPYSICDAGSCLSTTVITAGQRAVMQRYTGTL